MTLTHAPAVDEATTSDATEAIRLLASAVAELERTLEAIAPTAPADGVEDTYAAMTEALGIRRAINDAACGRHRFVYNPVALGVAPPPAFAAALERAALLGRLLIARQVVGFADLRALNFDDEAVAIIANRREELMQRSVDAMFRAVESLAGELVG